MRYRIKRKYINSPDCVLFTAASNNSATVIPSVKREFELPRVALPLDRIELVFSLTVSTAGSTSILYPLGMIESVGNIKLTRTPTAGSSNISHSLSGPALFEWMVNTLYGNVDADTKACYNLGSNVVAKTVGIGVATATYRFKLVLPCANPQFADGPGIPLRTFSCADVHNDSQPPVLSIETITSDLWALNAVTGGAKPYFSNMSVSICCHYADISQAVNADIMKRSGYLQGDLIESTKKTFTTDGVDFVKLPSPGSAAAVLLRAWTNNTAPSNAMTRGLPCNAGDVWELLYAEDPVDEFKLSDQQRLAGESLGDNLWSMPGSFFFDYLTNSVGQDPSNDLGSVRPLPAGIDTKLQGNILGASSAVDLKLVVQRYMGDLSPARFAVKA